MKQDYARRLGTSSANRTHAGVGSSFRAALVPTQWHLARRSDGARRIVWRRRWFAVLAHKTRVGLLANVLVCACARVLFCVCVCCVMWCYLFGMRFRPRSSGPRGEARLCLACRRSSASRRARKSELGCVCSTTHLILAFYNTVLPLTVPPRPLKKNSPIGPIPHPRLGPLRRLRLRRHLRLPPSMIYGALCL